MLHLGCGGESLPPNMRHCQEVRLDIDPACNPDIIGDMANLPEDIGPFDAAYASHSNSEHLFPHDVESCLNGVFRSLKLGGAVIIQASLTWVAYPRLKMCFTPSPVGTFMRSGPVLRLAQILKRQASHGAPNRVCEINAEKCASEGRFSGSEGGQGA